MHLVLPRPLVADKPYDEAVIEAMTTGEWWAIPPVSVPLGDLVPAQPHLLVDRLTYLLAGDLPEHGDPCLHVVRWGGRLYLHDGNHRATLHLVQGRRRVQVRICDLEGS